VVQEEYTNSPGRLGEITETTGNRKIAYNWRRNGSVHENRSKLVTRGFSGIPNSILTIDFPGGAGGPSVGLSGGDLGGNGSVHENLSKIDTRGFSELPNSFPALSEEIIVKNRTGRVSLLQFSLLFFCTIIRF
jgi:hypothetical protein